MVRFYGLSRAAVIVAALPLLAGPVGAGAMPKDDGYRGIWFTLGQKSEYGDKYSGGLGTYTAKHVPLAVYAPKARKTFFVWGGTKKGARHLLAMASCYDHATGLVQRPTIVHDKEGVSDPHDDPSICLDDHGHVWVFVAGRSTRRDGFIYRSIEPHNADSLELVKVHRLMAYPQPWNVPGRGFVYVFTHYTKGRELYWQTSPDGRMWSEERKLAGFGGHYQVSWQRGGTVVTAMNWHPGGNVDRRTNLYFLKSDDFGKTWKTAAGAPVATPLSSPENPALVRDFQSEGKLVYLKDINFDAAGRPVILFVTSHGWKPGPQDPPRAFMTARWTGTAWDIRPVATTDHNYDMGSLYIEPGGVWRVIAPTEPGPQAWGTGGEMTMLLSSTQGQCWDKIKDLTAKSSRNHAYARRPVNAHPGFYAFWADGDPYAYSESFLYFTTQAGEVYRLPPVMTGPTARPEPVTPAESKP